METWRANPKWSFPNDVVKFQLGQSKLRGSKSPTTKTFFKSIATLGGGGEVRWCTCTRDFGVPLSPAPTTDACFKADKTVDRRRSPPCFAVRDLDAACFLVTPRELLLPMMNKSVLYGGINVVE